MQLESHLSAEELLRRPELALGFAGIAGERTQVGLELARQGRAMQRAAFELPFGPVPTEIDALSDDQLLSELCG